MARYIRKRPLFKRSQSAKEMKKMVRNFSSDLEKFAHLPFDVYFDIVRKMPYEKDRKGVEVVKSPRETFKAGKGDCKKKAVLVASYANNRWGPKSWRFVASSNRPDKRITHVFPEIKIGGKWLNADATYPRFYFGKPKKITRYEIL